MKSESNAAEVLQLKETVQRDHTDYAKVIAELKEDVNTLKAEMEKLKTTSSGGAESSEGKFSIVAGTTLCFCDYVILINSLA